MEISQKLPPGKGVSPKERDSLISYLIGFIHAMCVCVCDVLYKFSFSGEKESYIDEQK